MVALVVTVIHGTFETEATWTQDGSPLLSAILKRFGQAEVRRLKWSGKNSFRARHEGVRCLETHVTKIERDHPRSPHFLIGHSHGGSIMAYWIKKAPRNAERIAGAAFLSTPFIAVQPARHALKLAGQIATHGV